MALSRTARQLGLGAVLWLAALAAPAQASHVVLFAAASTTEPLSEIVHHYEAEGRGDVAVSFGSSSTLAKQIENGAPADIFLSADEAWMDYLAKRDLVSRETRTNYLRNSLVLIAPQDSELAVTIAPGFPLAASLHNGRLAMGDPDHVPAGIYGKAALEKLGVWKSVEPQVVRANDVRAALAYVERGEAAAGIVYATDAAHARVRVVGTFPESSHPPIVYPLAKVAGHDDPAVRALLDYLRSDKVKKIFEEYGFKSD
jgi:molybdate transport system substrate-binding protein